MAWINQNDWHVEKPMKQRSVRQAIATVLIALADALTPAANQGTQGA